MRKLFFIAAIASAELVSCTKNELAPSAMEQDQITFATPVSHSITKADLVPAIYPTDREFAVFADYHTTGWSTDATNNKAANYKPYMRGSEGVVVEYTTGSTPFDKFWAPEDNYYWPKDGYLTFAAYSPASAKEHATIEYSITNGVQITGYEVKPNKTNQHDLMLSNRAVNQVSASMTSNVGGTEYDGVNLAFKHVLSAIKFSVKTDANYSDDNYTIKLKSITVDNAYTKGNLSQFTAITVDAVNLGNVWSEQNTGGTYAVYSGEESLSTSPFYPAGTENLTTGANMADLILLPQTLTRSAADKVTATIVYSVSHPDMGEASIDYTSVLPLSTTTYPNWVAGVRYIYNVTIGMDKVVFAPTVKKWDSGDPGDPIDL